MYVGVYKFLIWNFIFLLLCKVKWLEFVILLLLKLEEIEINVEKCDFCGVFDSLMWYKDIDRIV